VDSRKRSNFVFIIGYYFCDSFYISNSVRRDKMNRENKLSLLVSKVNEWPKPSFNGTGRTYDWSFQDGKYIHPDYEPITINDWNRAKIVPNTKIRILSPEHSEYVQKLAFEAGFSWLEGKVTQYTSEIALFFWEDDHICHSNNHRSFDNPSSSCQ
jgi:hypothetical protein